MKTRLIILSQLWKPFLHTNIPTYAASACYFFLLSLLPTALLLISSLPYIPLPVEFWSLLVSEVLPDILQPLLSDFYRYITASDSVAVISLSALSLLWSASKSVMSISDGLNAAMGTTAKRSYFKKRIVSILYFLLLSISLLISAFVLIFAGLLIKTVTNLIPGLRPIIEFIFHFRGILSFFLLSAIFCISYRYLPSKKLAWRSCVLGASLVSLCWLVLSVIFSLYVSYSANNQRSDFLSIIILGTIWFRGCIMLLLYGGLLADLIGQGRYRPIKIIRSAFWP